MNQRLKVIGIVIVLVLLIDLYVFQAVRTAFHAVQPLTKKIIYITYWAITFLTLTSLILSLIYEIEQWPKTFRMYLFAAMFIIYASKIVVVVFLLIEDLTRLMKWVASLLYTPQLNPNGIKIPRSEFISKLALIAGGVPLATLLYGMSNIYNYNVKRVKIVLPNLPAAFNNLKIIQLSDIHAGSFTKTKPVIEAIEAINKENPDLIFFTGDLVNNKAEEMEGYTAIFGALKAKHGVFSIFGNHDYGDYVQWGTPQAKKENLNTLAAMHKQMGWKLLRNEHFLLEKEGAQIAIIGVENWSAKMRFPKYGNLKQAYEGSAQAPVKLLLSHDPSHWDVEVSEKYKDIDVSFAGHTHGMQFGIEIPGIKWSPVQYVYKYWAGLYQKGAQYLYVNRGFGFIGYPGRVGILPEITVFELVKG